MGVGDAQLDPVQPTSPQPAEELAPERLGLGRAHIQPDHLPAARFVHRVGDHQRLVAHPTALADPLDLGVHPQVGVGPLQGPLPEDADLLVQAAAQPGDLVLTQLVQARLLHQPVDLAGGDPVDIGLLDDGDQGLLGAAARLQKRREVAARAELGDGQRRSGSVATQVDVQLPPGDRARTRWVKMDSDGVYEAHLITTSSGSVSPWRSAGLQGGMAWSPHSASDRGAGKWRRMPERPTIGSPRGRVRRPDPYPISSAAACLSPGKCSRAGTQRSTR